MGAIAGHYKIGESVVETLQAGADVAMLSHNWDLVAPALEAVAPAFSGAPDAEVNAQVAAQSRARIERLRQRLREIEKSETPPVEVIGCREHRALAAEIRARINDVST
jgi:beta-glucosidase-like glycosyl hydrolase